MLLSFRKLIAPTVLKSVSIILRHGPLGPTAKRNLWRLAQRYFCFLDIEAEAKIVNGMVMRVTSNPRVEQEILLFGEWEPLFTRYLMSHTPERGAFIDIGANIGYFSLVASKVFDEVHAIEASPKTCRRLSGNISANDLNNITIHNVAVGSERGTVEFYKDLYQSGGSSLVKNDHNAFECSVPMRPLEDILDGIEWRKVRFIKIDVEGSEIAVLESLMKISDHLTAPFKIFIEYDPTQTGLWAKIEELFRQGFAAYFLQGPYDMGDYVEKGRRTALQSIAAAPPVFCDLLLVKQQG